MALKIKWARVRALSSRTPLDCPGRARNSPGLLYPIFPVRTMSCEPESTPTKPSNRPENGL
jgi:hypothetical protein